MSAVIDGQVDVFELLGEDKAACQPPFRVYPLKSRWKAICGWCGGSGLLGGGACRHPDNAELSIGYDYCQKCVDKYGHPKVFPGGTPLVLIGAAV